MNVSEILYGFSLFNGRSLSLRIIHICVKMGSPQLSRANTLIISNFFI